MWFDRHRVFRRLTLAWAVWLITVTTFEYFGSIGKITSADAVVITGVIGILTAVIGFQRDRDDSNSK